MATNTSVLASRGSSSRRALIVALAFGAIAALLVFSLLSRSGGSDASVATTPVLVAAQDIPLGQPITDTNTALKPVATSATHPLAFTDKTKPSAMGQIALEPLSTGQQILTSEVTKDKSQVGLTSVIPAGYRAVAITVPNEAATTGGFVRPGDHVDIIGTFQVNAPAPAGDVLVLGKGDSGAKHLVAVTLLQNVQVLAIGQTAVAPDQTTGSPNNLQPSSAQVQAKSVTFALTPDQAQKIILAQDIGSLVLVERPLGDTQQTAVVPSDNSLNGLASGGQ